MMKTIVSSWVRVAGLSSTAAGWRRWWRRCREVETGARAGARPPSRTRRSARRRRPSRARAEAGDVGLGEQLHRVPVRRCADVLDALRPFGTFLAATARRATARCRAAVIAPSLRRPTMMTGTRVDLADQRLGEVAAIVLGTLGGRNAELSLLTWLASDGRK